MGAKTYVNIVTVRGTGYFPIDMLRYDRCTPATEEDSGNIVRDMPTAEGYSERTVDVRYEGPTKEPHVTVDRWKSFGWTVVSTRRAYA